VKGNKFYRMLLFTATALALSSSVALAQDSSLVGNAENGKKLFATYFCWSCHGSNGRAGGTAPAIAPGTRSAEDLKNRSPRL